MRQFFLGVAPLALLMAAHGQSSAPPSQLKIEKQTSLPVVLGKEPSTETRCGLNSDIYLYETGWTYAEGTYVLRISADGQSFAKIDPDAVPELHKLEDWGVIALDRSGRVYLAAIKYNHPPQEKEGEGEPDVAPSAPDASDTAVEKKDSDSAQKKDTDDTEPEFVSSHIAVFDRDGKHVSTITLDYPVEPRGLAIFGTGEFLVVGWDHSPGAKSHQPFTAIFDWRGTLQRKVKLRDTASVSTPGSLASKSATVSSADSWLNVRVESGFDGNVYVVHDGDNAPIYALSADGRLQRRLRIPAVAGSHVRAIRISTNRIAALYAPAKKGAQPLTLKQLDLQSGEVLGTYVLEDSHGVFACLAGDTLSFVSTDKQQRLQVLLASPER